MPIPAAPAIKIIAPYAQFILELKKFFIHQKQIYFPGLLLKARIYAFVLAKEHLSTSQHLFIKLVAPRPLTTLFSINF